MGGISLEQFGGAIPIVGNRLLPTNFAARAVNTDLISGELRGQPSLGLVHEMEDGPWEKAFRIPAEAGQPEVWMGFASRFGTMMKNSISNDVYLRYIILDGNSPGTAVPPRFNTHARIVAGQPSFVLGIPAPTTVPTLATAGGSGADVTRSYIYTFVDAYGQEGQPSPARLGVGKIDGTWTLSGLETSVPDAANRPAMTKRIYRTVFTNSGVATFRRVADVALAATSYVDSASEDVIAGNVAIESISWAAPPVMEGMVASANGFFVGWNGTDVYFSEPYRPWAWPPEYTTTVNHRIVGCAFVDQTLVVVTVSHPTFLNGSTPSAISKSQTETVEAGVSAPSIVAGPDGVYFATKTGLLRASSAGLENVTTKLIDSVQWSRQYGENIRSAVRYETTYIGITSTGGGFTMDWADQRVAFSELKNDLPFDMIWTDQWTGEIHAMVNNSVYKFGDESFGRQNFLWRSKEFVLPKPTNMAALLVSMETGSSTNLPWGLQGKDALLTELPVPTPIEIDPDAVSSVLNEAGFNTFMLNERGRVTTPDVSFEESLALPEGVPAWLIVYANRRIVWQGAVASDQMVRLPSGFKSVTWQVSLVSRTSLYSIKLAETAKDLALV